MERPTLEVSIGDRQLVVGSLRLGAVRQNAQHIQILNAMRSRPAGQIPGADEIGAMIAVVTYSANIRTPDAVAEFTAYVDDLDWVTAMTGLSRAFVAIMEMTGLERKDPSPGEPAPGEAASS